MAFHFRLIEQQLSRLVKGFLHHNFKFACLSSGSFQMDRAAFAYIILCPCPLLREGWVQAAQKAELCFCHAVVFHAVLPVFLKIHTATAQRSASHPVCLHFSSARMIIVKALPSPCGCSGYRSSLLPSEKSPCTRCSPGQ